MVCRFVSFSTQFLYFLGFSAFGALYSNRCAPSRKTWIDHHVSMYIERRRALGRLDAYILAIGFQTPALRFVIKIGDHNLIENLAMDRWVFDGTEHLYSTI